MPTSLHKLHIKKFRIFEDKTFHFGKYVTAIAGQNGVGKSNILGLVANCIQYKKKGQRKESFFSPKQFRAEFHELFKGSAEHDRSGSGLMRFTFSDGDTRECRITWQKIHSKDASQENIQGDASPDTKDDQQKRFRIIPYRDIPGARRTHTKKEMAPIYLGLSRLYPVGESSHCSAVGLQHENPEATQWIVDQALQILSVPIGTNSSVEMDSVKISDVKRKTGVGFKADTYDALANSAGQDNIGQILLAIWKIKALKEDLGDDFPGAILLIDEFDATLHPASQRKLLDLLIREAKKAEFQTVFTTHSLYLLNLLSGRVEHNAKGSEDVNDIEINYLTTANGSLECLRNPAFSVIGNDLKEQLAKYPQRIKIYTEDIELYEDDAIQLLERMEPRLRKHPALFYLDPPYYHKGSMLYQNFYEPEDHENVARRVEKLSSPWLVSYDNAQPINALYSQYRSMTYSLNYTAHRKVMGDEFMAFSDHLQLPENLLSGTMKISPMHNIQFKESA